MNTNDSTPGFYFFLVFSTFNSQAAVSILPTTRKSQLPLVIGYYYYLFFADVLTYLLRLFFLYIGNEYFTPQSFCYLFFDLFIDFSSMRCSADFSVSCKAQTENISA